MIDFISILADNIRQSMSVVFDIFGDLLVILLPFFVLALCVWYIVFLFKN